MTTSDLKRAMDRRFDRTDRRLDRLERTKVDKTEFRKAITNLRTALRREVATAAGRLRGEIKGSAAETCQYVDRLGSGFRDEIAASAAETRQYVDVTAGRLESSLRGEIGVAVEGLRGEIASAGAGLRGEIASAAAGLREEIASSAAETRRHFDVVAESIRDGTKVFADGIDAHRERLDKHEERITKLERRRV
jgi:hypothetical protein